MKKRVFYLDFIRALSALFIIVFHFNCSIGGHEIYKSVSNIPIIFYEYKNGNLGQIGVSLFFIISGGLMLSNQCNFNIREYLKKRFLAIFPMFYFAYFCVTFYYFLHYRSLNPFCVPRNKLSFLITIVGMDGYVSPIIPNYYIIGEWFLGCIILFYILFPLLRTLLLKLGPWISMLCIFLIYVATVHLYPFASYPKEYFVLIRIVEFFFGMLAVTYIKEIRKWQLCISGISIAILSVYYLPIIQSYKTTIMGMSLYVVWVYAGQHIPERFQKLFLDISKYSYPAYLLHHVIIEQICSLFEGIELSLLDTYFLLITCIVVIIIFTVLFVKLYGIIKTYCFKICEVQTEIRN